MQQIVDKFIDREKGSQNQRKNKYTIYIKTENKSLLLIGQTGNAIFVGKTLINPKTTKEQKKINKTEIAFFSMRKAQMQF